MNIFKRSMLLSVFAVAGLCAPEEDFQKKAASVETPKELSDQLHKNLIERRQAERERDQLNSRWKWLRSKEQNDKADARVKELDSMIKNHQAKINLVSKQIDSNFVEHRVVQAIPVDGQVVQGIPVSFEPLKPYVPDKREQDNDENVFKSDDQGSARQDKRAVKKRQDKRAVKKRQDKRAVKKFKKN